MKESLGDESTGMLLRLLVGRILGSFAAVMGSLVYLEVLYNLLPSYLRVAMYTVM